MAQSRRLDLHEILVDLAGEDGHVYFQPPTNTKIIYPCIIYKRDDIFIAHADNAPYKNKVRYQVTVIDQNPDSEIHTKIGELPTASYDRSFTADGLNHDVYNLYF